MNKVSEMVEVALLSAILVISKELLAFLPNIELVTFLLIMYAKHFKLKNSLMITNVFCLIQMILYGFGEWTIMYFIVFNGLCILVSCLKNKSRDFWSIFSALFGLTFGLFFSLPYLLLSFESAFAYWIKGIFFDCIHAVGNYLVMMILYDRIDSWMNHYFTDKF